MKKQKLIDFIIIPICQFVCFMAIVFVPECIILSSKRIVRLFWGSRFFPENYNFEESRGMIHFLNEIDKEVKDLKLRLEGRKCQ